MPVAVMQQEPDWQIRMEGDLGVTSAIDLRTLLVEWAESGRNLELDLESATALDISVMQLLYAAAQEAARSGATIVGRLSTAASLALADSGFEQLTGLKAQGAS